MFINFEKAAITPIAQLIIKCRLKKFELVFISKLSVVYIIKIINYDIKFISIDYEFIAFYNPFNSIFNIITFIVFWLLLITLVIFVLYKTTLEIKAEGNKQIVIMNYFNSIRYV